MRSRVGNPARGKFKEEEMKSKVRTIIELQEAIKDIGPMDSSDYSTIQKVIAFTLLEILKELRKK